MKLRVATCQFPVSANVDANARYVRRQMRAAKRGGARVAHFCEGALSGYVGVDFPSFDGYDWKRLQERTREIQEAVKDLGIWVVLGSSHPLTGRNKPHNSVYVINDRGRIHDRYDKRFCAGTVGDPAGELAHFTPGDHSCVFTIDGVKCGVLICHEYRYPELYREHKHRGAQLVFHSFHAGNVPPGRLLKMRRQVGKANSAHNSGSTLPEITMPASMVAAAAGSHVWISAANSSRRESCWPAFFVRADGVVMGKLVRNRAGVLMSEVDTEAPLYDSTAPWRARAMKGVLHSGRLVDDPRSKDRRKL